MICMILLKETNGSREIHAELAECLLHILSEQKVLVTTLDDYYLMSRIFTQIRPYLIEQKANFIRVISRLKTQSDMVR